MKTSDNFEHPEIIEMMHICSVTPDGGGIKEICELFKSATRISQSKIQTKRLKKEKEWDRNLEDTFPASDPIAHY